MMTYLSARIDPQNSQFLHYKEISCEQITLSTCRVLMRHQWIIVKESSDKLNFTLRNDFCRSPDLTNYLIEGDKGDFARSIIDVLQESGYELSCQPGSPQGILYLSAHPAPFQPPLYSAVRGG